MARSGSGSRTSRGVSSWSAAVSTPTFMNFGSNDFVDISRSVLFSLTRTASPKPQTPSPEPLILHLRPDAALPGTRENGLDDRVGAIAVFKRGKRRRMTASRLPAFGDRAIDVPHDVGKRVGPRFLMATREVRIAP